MGVRTSYVPEQGQIKQYIQHLCHSVTVLIDDSQVMRRNCGVSFGRICPMSDLCTCRRPIPYLPNSPTSVHAHKAREHFATENSYLTVSTRTIGSNAVFRLAAIELSHAESLVETPTGARGCVRFVDKTSR
jgi:hypothetical protein